METIESIRQVIAIWQTNGDAEAPWVLVWVVEFLKNMAKPILI